MPIWLINIIISFALKLGMAFLLKKFPGIPDEIRQIIQEMIDAIKSSPGDKDEIVKNAKVKIKSKLVK